MNTKSRLTRKLDKLCSKIIRSKGSCESCGKTENLQCCHIFSRTYRSLRWSLDNLLCLCAGCHHWSHKNPIFFTEWVKKHKGDDAYELLKENYRAITKLTVADLEIKLKILQEIENEKL
jgi:5-methylcytosine-specific restriction endonuclease McrA